MTATPARALALTVSSETAVTFLTSPDEHARTDAFNHLIAILLTATQGLYIPENEKYPGNSARHSFAEEFLLGELEPYFGQPKEMILQAARDDKFRYLGRRFRQRLLNRIRDTVRRNQKYGHERYNDAWETHTDAGGVDGSVLLVALNECNPEEYSIIPPVGPEEYDRYFERFDFLSDQDIAVATALFDLRHEDYTKGERTRALAERFGVTEQTARRYLRNLRTKMTNALKDGNADVQDFFSRLREFIKTAPLAARDECWPSDPDAPNPGAISPRGACGETIQFDDQGKFGYHQYQDMKHHERDWDSATLAENGRGYSWNQRDSLKRASRISS